MKTILYGNGVNLLVGAPKWDDLLVKIDNTWNSSKSLSCITPPTIQYDQLELTSNTSSKKLLDNLCLTISGPWKNLIYEQLANMCDVNFLTTNYDLTLESYFASPLKIGKEVIFNLFSYYCEEHNDTEKGNGVSLYGKGNIWHIHGDIMRPDSIILGYNHYCKQITKIREYIPSLYVSQLPSSYGSRHAVGGDWSGKSWIDLFFRSDVFIIGLGLGFAELDLWWILDLWARCKKAKLVSNRIVYLDAVCGMATSCKCPFVRVLHDFGIEYVSQSGSTYMEAYEKCLDYIRK